MKSKIAAPVEETTEEIPEVKPERFVDLMVFCLAYDSFAGEMELAGGKVSKDPLWLKGYQTAIRFSAELHQGVTKYVLPLASHPEAGALKTVIAQGMRGTGVTLAKNQAVMLGKLLIWLRSHSDVSRETFSGRSAKSVQLATLAMTEDSAASRLNKLAAIPSLSGLRVMSQWMTQASERLGAPLSTVEEVVRDAETAANLGDDLKSVRGKIQGAVPNSPESANLIAKEQETLGKIEKIVQTSKNPTAVLAAASVAATSQRSGYKTETGKRLGHTPEQEEAMMVRGRAVIAAGAGSGKTRVLASKVAYHINELGIPATSILACSFTRKASAELTQRIQNYGAVIDGLASANFGTTHSIAGKLLNTKAKSFRRPAYLGRNEGWKQDTILRLAMKQVQMSSKVTDETPSAQPPVIESFWARSQAVQEQGPGQGSGQGSEQGLRQGPTTLQEAVNTALGYFKWEERTFSGLPSKKFYANRATQNISFLESMRKVNPSYLTTAQKEALNNVFSQVRGKGAFPFRVAGYNPGSLVTAEVLTRTLTAEDESENETEEEVINKLAKYKFSKTPANKWFNIKNDLAKIDSKGNSDPIPMREFKKFISITKGRGVSPTEAFDLALKEEKEEEERKRKDPMAPPKKRSYYREYAAVYGAYEWLKGASGEPEFQGHGDMDDILIDTVRALIGDPSLRRQLNAQYKVLLIDEAQDLNPVQHLMFGLMAGYLDPKTLKPNPDKKMTADTFAFIGDDKQAIYEFRGANPDEFIDKSDLTKGGDNFTTKLLDINFRSGSAIVNAAGNLIARNEKQIPMACRTTERKGTGNISSVKLESVDEAVKYVAEEVAELISSGEVPPFRKIDGKGGYANFGIAVRSNDEAYAYGLQMIMKNIPFKSKVNFFNEKSVKALIGWLTLVEQGQNGNPEIVNNAVLDALSMPLSMLGSAFKDKLKGLASGNFVKFLLSPGAANRIMGYGSRADTLQVFINNVRDVLDLQGPPTEILKNILNLKGVDGKNSVDVLIRDLKKDEERMSEITSEKGEVSAEAIRDKALSPIKPLQSVLEGQDTVGAAMGYIRQLQTVNSKISSDDTENEVGRNAVTISTMHGWKGLEVSHMYIPMVGGKFPREQASEEDLASERRLAYVAVTRGEDYVKILDIPMNISKGETGSLQIRSRFIKEMCLPGSAPKTASRDKWADGPLLYALMNEDYAELNRLAALEENWGEVLS